MKALVVGSDFTECSRVTKILRDAGHEVKIFNDEKAALAVLTPESAQAILVYAMAPSDGVLEFIKQARIKAALTTPIFFGSDLPEPFALRAAEAGVTAEIRKFAGKDLVLARIASMQAYAALVHRAALGETTQAVVATPGAGAGAAGAAAAAPDTQSGPLEQMARTNAWRTATSAVVGRTSQFLSLDTRLDGAPPNTVPVEVGTSLVLSNVEKQVELRVAMACSKAGAETLAVHMMGDDGKGLGQDFLQEVCNLTMGVLKDAFAEESVAFTSGVPAPMAPEHALTPPNFYRFSEVVVLKALDVRLVLHLGLRSRANLRVVPADVTEGMVLAKDLFNNKGLLLTKAGTRLSSSMIERLRNVMPNDTTLEVMAA